MNNPGTSGEVKFKTSMKILKKDDGGPVYFKFDGGRFQHEETIKILTGSQYRVILEFKPSMDLRYYFMGLRKFDYFCNYNVCLLTYRYSCYGSSLLCMA